MPAERLARTVTLLNAAMEPEDVTFQFLQEITDGFSENRKLGSGSFGVVYRVRFWQVLFSI